MVEHHIFIQSLWSPAYCAFCGEGAFQAIHSVLGKKANEFLRQNDKPPAHYAKGKYSPWEIIQDWKLEYFCGNAVKYICRHRHKGKPVEDIQKAIDCLREYKKILEKEDNEKAQVE